MCNEESIEVYSKDSSEYATSTVTTNVKSFTSNPFLSQKDVRKMGKNNGHVNNFRRQNPFFFFN